VLKDFGRYDESADVFRQLQKEHPSMEGVSEHLGWLEQAKKSYGIE
jgi:hypothetical protein